VRRRHFGGHPLYRLARGQSNFRGASVLKAVPYLEALGLLYYFRTVSCLVLSLLAIKVNNRIYQASFAVYALVCELGWKRLAPPETRR
jgi:hypothetical protein